MPHSMMPAVSMMDGHTTKRHKYIDREKHPNCNETYRVQVQLGQQHALPSDHTHLKDTGKGNPVT